MKQRTQELAQWVPWLLAPLLVSGYAWFGASQSFFFSDEMESLYRLRSHGLASFLWQPLNVQLVPLHRLGTWLLHALFGMSFEVHVVAMWLLSLAYLWTLRRVLSQLVGAGALSALLVLFAASYGIFGANLLWFSSCLHRLPYAIATLLAYDVWLRLRVQRPFRAAVGIALLTLIAEGFYAKGVLLPFYVVALELCLLTRPGHPADNSAAQLRHRGLALAPTLLAAIGLAVLAQRAANAELGTAGSSWFGVTFSATWRVLVASLVGGVRPEQFAALPSFPAVATGVLFALALMLASVARRPRNVVVWGVVLTCAFGNGLVLSFSNRGQIWGPLVAVSYRYYLDITMVVLPMVAIGLADLRLPTLRPTAVAATVTGAAMALSVAQVGSFRQLVAHDLRGHLKTRQVVDRLRSEVMRVRRDVPPHRQSIRNEVLPRPLIMFPGVYSSVRHLFQVLELPLSVHDDGFLVMEDDGRLVPKPADFQPDRRTRTWRERQSVLTSEVRTRWKELL